MLRSPVHDGVIETLLPSPVRIPQGENVFSAGMFPRDFRFRPPVSAALSEGWLARPRGKGSPRPSQADDSNCGMQGTLPSGCTLLVIRDGAELCLRLLAERR